MEMNFCRRCGSALTNQQGNAYHCGKNHIIYRNASPTASVFIVTRSGKVLLGRRGIEPFKGALDSIGGFLDADETFEQAAIREITEESGLKPGDYSPLQYLSSSLLDYEYDGEAVPIIAANFWTTLKTDRVPVASDDLVEIIECPIDQNTLQQIQAKDVRAGFRALIERKCDIITI